MSRTWCTFIFLHSYAWTLTSREHFPSVPGLFSGFKHVLLYCVSFTNARDDIFCVTLTLMSELFSKVASRSIVNVIKDAGFSYTI